MAEISSFFRSIGGDRQYSADKFAEYFRSFLTNGVFNGGTSLKVDCNDTDMKSRVAVGKGWIEGYYYYNNSELELTHNTADLVNPRIDRVVVRLDLTETGRHIKAFIKRGTPAVTPVAPALTRDLAAGGALRYEISLAQVLVPANSTTILSANITDERLDQNLCGLVNSLIQADTQTIHDQFEAWYNLKVPQYESDWQTWYNSNVPQYESDWQKWFDSVKGLSTGVVGIQEFFGTATLPSSTSRVTVPRNEYNYMTDVMHVYQNSTFLLEGRDYQRDMINGTDIIFLNGDKKAGTVLDFIIIKAKTEVLDKTDGGLMQDGTITKPKLSLEVQNVLDDVSVIRSEAVAHKADIMPHQSGLNSYSSNKDANGVYTVVEYKRANGTLYMRSSLSGGTSPNYTIDTWDFYAEDGITLLETKTWTLTYDVDGNIVSKVVA